MSIPNIQKLFKKYIVKRPNGNCQVLFALTELDDLCMEIYSSVNKEIADEFLTELKRLKEGLEWIAQQSCEREIVAGTAICSSTDDCVTKYCYPCYARMVLETVIQKNI